MTDRTCEIEGCDKPRFCRGWCGMHYMRWWKFGDVNYVRPSLTPVERFWAKVDKNGPTVEARPDLGPCWVWTGTPLLTGYGQFHVDGKTVRAHRFAYELLVGPIPAKLEPDHLCHTYDPHCPGGWTCPHRMCVNPAHLEPVTRSENGWRRWNRSLATVEP